MILFITGVLLVVLLFLRVVGILKGAARDVVASLVIVAGLVPVLVFTVTLGQKPNADITALKIAAAVGELLGRLMVWGVYDHGFRRGLLPDGRVIRWGIWAGAAVTVGSGVVSAVMHQDGAVLFLTGLVPSVLCKLPGVRSGTCADGFDYSTRSRNRATSRTKSEGDGIEEAAPRGVQPGFAVGGCGSGGGVQVPDGEGGSRERDVYAVERGGDSVLGARGRVAWICISFEGETQENGGVWQGGGWAGQGERGE